MELQGKKAVFLGDSITEGHGTSEKAHIFMNILARETGLSEALNFGIGGTRIARQQHVDPSCPWDRDFCMRVEELPEDADIVVVFGGTNDFGHGDAPIGTFADRSPETFHGACHYLMNRLCERYYDRTVVIMTPLHRLGEDERRDGRPPLDTFVEIIRRTAEYYAIPTLDLYKNSRIQPAVPIVRETYCPDGLHPNDAGHALIAGLLQKYLENL